MGFASCLHRALCHLSCFRFPIPDTETETEPSSRFPSWLFVASRLILLQAEFQEAYLRLDEDVFPNAGDAFFSFGQGDEGFVEEHLIGRAPVSNHQIQSAVVVQIAQCGRGGL